MKPWNKIKWQKANAVIANSILSDFTMKNKTKKILVIAHCEDCCFCVHDDQERRERWGKYWCTVADKETDAVGIPKFCPLPTAQRNAKTSAEMVKEFKLV